MAGDNDDRGEASDVNLTDFFLRLPTGGQFSGADVSSLIGITTEQGAGKMSGSECIRKNITSMVMQ